MRRCRRILVAWAVAIIAPTAAMAQPIVTVTSGPAFTTTSIPVRITGLLFVQFHGDPSAGCARWGLCGYSGTVSWRPPPTASVQIERTSGRHSRTAVQLFPDFNARPQTPNGVTTASVTLAGGPSEPASRCLDAGQSGEAASFQLRGGRVTFSLSRESPSLLLTRCAGPRDADVLPQVPAPTIPLTTLERGHRTISLAASGLLHSHGFAGSITSTLAVHVGRPGKPRTETNHTSGRRGTPGREIVVTYRARLRGTVVEEIRGAANPLACEALGSCGVTGTITMTPPAAATTAHLTVDAHATTPRRELLAAAGLGPGSPGRVGGFGALSWRAGGTVAADLRQGSEHCVDTAPAGNLGLIIATGAGHWTLSSFFGGVIGSPGTATRCPGPVPSMQAIGSSAAPLASLDGRTAQIMVTTGSIAHDDGYRVRIVPHLMVTLTRVKVRMRAIRVPPGEVLSG